MSSPLADRRKVPPLTPEQQEKIAAIHVLYRLSGVKDICCGCWNDGARSPCGGNRYQIGASNALIERMQPATWDCARCGTPGCGANHYVRSHQCHTCSFLR